jgi:hypothetical protein
MQQERREGPSTNTHDRATGLQADTLRGSDAGMQVGWGLWTNLLRRRGAWTWGPGRPAYLRAQSTIHHAGALAAHVMHTDVQQQRGEAAQCIVRGHFALTWSQREQARQQQQQRP